MILIDAIEMAQLQEDLLKEDILFNYLIELLRNPEDLKTSTGSLLERRLMVHRNKQKIEKYKKNAKRKLMEH